MNQPLVDQKQCLERHRPYLMLLTRAHLSRQHPASCRWTEGLATPPLGLNVVKFV